MMKSSILGASIATAAQASSVTFLLKQDQTRLDELDRVFRAVSDPEHDDYGMFISRDQAAEFMSPDSASLKHVTDHLTQLGVPFSTSFAKEKVFVDFLPSHVTKEQLAPTHVLDAVDRTWR